jgi:AcrR family transcriptional regulator
LYSFDVPSRAAWLAADTFAEVDELGAAREQLVDAAWQVLARTGFEGFKVSSVIRATGVSTRTFYRCFSSKDDLFVELLVDETRRAAERIGRIVAGEPDPGSRVAAWVAAIMSAASTTELLPRARMFTNLADQIDGRPEVFAMIRTMMLPPLIDAIEQGCAAGTMQSPDTSADARMINSLCRAAISDIVRGRCDEDAATVISQVQSLALRALRPGA